MRADTCVFLTENSLKLHFTGVHQPATSAVNNNTFALPSTPFHLNIASKGTSCTEVVDVTHLCIDWNANNRNCDVTVTIETVGKNPGLPI